MELFLGAQRIRIRPQSAIGQGGEADVYDLGDGRALKLFKDERHPDLAGQPLEQAAARARLDLQQRKLPAFPRSLPAEVIAPDELARDSRGAVAGYAMRLVANAEPLLRFAEPAFRNAGATSARVAAAFSAFHRTLTAVHQQGVLLGDLNDLNILVPSGAAPLLIDADSFQFGGFPCLTFTERFLDPRLAGANALQLVPTAPYDLASDWFGFCALLVQSLLCVGPWGGTHRPSGTAQLVPQRRRALERVSIFRDEVQLPRAALPRESLPDELLHQLLLTFERDERRPLPLPLLEQLAFQRCASCGLEHARAACPRCRPHAAAPLRRLVASRGSVSTRTLFESPGVIVAAALGDRGLQLVHHDGAAYRCEDSRALLESPLDPRLRFERSGDAAVISRAGQLVLLGPRGASQPLQVDLCAGAPVFATHGSRIVWSSAGQLLSAPVDALTPSRTGRGLQLPPLLLGEIVAQGTRLWLGPTFGVGLTHAGALSLAFLFTPTRRGLDDSLRLPALKGRLLRTRAAFTAERVWLLASLREGGRTVHRCLVLDGRGALLAQAEAEADDGSWLGALPQVCAAGELLFAATDEGLVRLELRGDRIAESRRFPDTAPFLDSETQLFAAGNQLLAVGRRRAVALALSQG